MATQSLTIQPVSAAPTASQIQMSSQDVMPNSKEILQALQSKSYKDQYAGSVQLDYTYSSLIKNQIRPRSSDIQYSSSDVVQTKENVISSREMTKYTAKTVTPSQSEVLPKASDVVASTKDLTKEGDIRFKIVKEISKEVEKSITEWNRYNLSKTNRLLKSVEPVKI